jgi:phosphoglycerate dehydrogenase-like enzyme
MAYYRKRLTPEQVAARRVKDEIARTKRIETLKSYAEQWKDPAQKPYMEKRAEVGRKSIIERRAIVIQSLQRFLQRQEEQKTRLQWIQTIGKGEQQIEMLIRQAGGGQATAIRAKSAEHLFRTMVREGMFKLNLETGLWENRCKLL